MATPTLAIAITAPSLPLLSVSLPPQRNPREHGMVLNSLSAAGNIMIVSGGSSVAPPGTIVRV
ncbi:hypothetical protein FDENT_14241, partial [Fusarium denticulatum]